MSGRPRRRGDARRAPRLRVIRAEKRRDQYEQDRGQARDLAAEVAAASDYLRGALRVVGTDQLDTHRVRRLLAELAATADEMYRNDARQANRDANTPRRRRVA